MKRGSRERGSRKPSGTAVASSGPAPRADIARAFVPRTLERVDGVAAAALGLAALVLYGSTACRTIYIGDSPELVTAAAIFGIPHPPGYPLFTIVTGVLVHLLPLDRPLAANLVAAIYAAGTVLLVSLLARRLHASHAGAAFAASSLAGGATFWAQGTAIEVYGFDLMLALLAAHAALSAHRSPRALALAVLAGSVWIGHRPLNVVYAPVLVLLGVATGVDLRRAVSEPRLLGPALAGALPYLWLPLRSLGDPALDVGDPETLDRFVTVVRSAPYVRHWLAGTFELGVARVARHVAVLGTELGLAAPVGLVGLAALMRGPGRGLALALGWALLVNVAIGAGYHVLDSETYFLPSTWALAVLSAPGLDRTLAWLRAPAQAAWLAPLGAVGLVAANFPTADLSAHRIARLAAEDTLEAAPERAIVVVDGDTSIHALWYLQAVEGARPDVIVLSPGHLSGWYLEQLRHRHPDEPWPHTSGETLDVQATSRRILRAFSGHRPIFATPSVALGGLGADGAPGDALGAMPRGLGSELLPVGTSIEIDERAVWSQGYFDRSMDRVLPVPARVEVDSAALYLEYALALTRTADLVARRHPDVARQLYQYVIALRPDEHDVAVRADLRDGLGREIPALDLFGHAAGALVELPDPE